MNPWEVMPVDHEEKTALLPRISGNTEQSVDFTTTWRGYLPTEVEAYVARSETELSGLREQVAKLQASLAEAEGRLADATAEANRWRRRYEDSTPPFEQFGQRIGQILALADEEAQSRRKAAEADAKKMLDDVDRRAKETIEEAQSRSRQLTSQAEQDLKRREAEARDALTALQTEHDALVERLTEIRATLTRIPGLQVTPASQASESSITDPAEAAEPESPKPSPPKSERAEPKATEPAASRSH